MALESMVLPELRGPYNSTALTRGDCTEHVEQEIRVEHSSIPTELAAYLGLNGVGSQRKHSVL